MSPPEHEKKLAEELRLRPERPTVTRLSRKVLITLAGVSSSLVLGLTLWALHERSGAKPPPELYNTDAKTTADGLATLPRDYTASAQKCPEARTAFAWRSWPADPRRAGSIAAIDD